MSFDRGKVCSCALAFSCCLCAVRWRYHSMLNLKIWKYGKISRFCRSGVQWDRDTSPNIWTEGYNHECFPIRSVWEVKSACCWLDLICWSHGIFISRKRIFYFNIDKEASASASVPQTRPLLGFCTWMLPEDLRPPDPLLYLRAMETDAGVTRCTDEGEIWGCVLGLRASGNLPVSYVLTGNLPVTYHQ